MRLTRPAPRRAITIACIAAVAAGLGLVSVHAEPEWLTTPPTPDASITGSISASKLTLGPLTAPRAPVGPEDLATLARAAGHYQRGQIAEGDALQAELGDPRARDAAEWLALRSGSPAIGARRLMRFIRERDDWGDHATLRRRAEEALLAQRIPAAEVLPFLAAHPPVSPAGRAAHILAMADSGARAAAIPLLKALWRDDHLGRELENLLIARFGDDLTARDHRDRMEMYLFKDNAPAALRNAERAGRDHVRLAQARLALNRGGTATAALAAVPATLRGDPSFIFAQAQSLRRQGKAAEAAALIRPLPRGAAALIDGDEWWVERRLIARQLLDHGEAALAHEVASGHSAEKPSAIIEAEWHAGWIALRFLNQPAVALAHFEAARRHAVTPISLARIAYWRGMALEALGDDDRAAQALREAARHPVAFYGQLARARIGLSDLALRDIHQVARTNAAAAANPALDAAQALIDGGAHTSARPLLIELARELDNLADLSRLARMVERLDDATLMVSIGKAVIQRGLPFDHIAYPATGLPELDSGGDARHLSVERAMLLAITRQESAFDLDAVSHAGARGLMQLMPATARETARRIGLPFDQARLTRDGAYNARLGAAHLADLMAEWRGSYVLMFAAYNAGSSNVRKWIQAYGDPRDGRVDPVDWIERIPFTETRNYVQRVIENLQVYRSRLQAAPRLLVTQDIRRGARLATFAGEGCLTVTLTNTRLALAP